MEGRTFIESDAGSVIHVHFTRGEAIYDKVFKATILRKGREERLWAISYEDRETAEEVEHMLRRLRSDSICSVRFLNPAGTEPLMLIEEGYEKFECWLGKKSPIWEYNLDNTKVLSMGYAFLSVFKGIIGGLRTLHYHNKYHGNLLNGVSISDDYKVKLFNISFKKTDYSHIDQGIQKDLNDLTELVFRVLRKHPPINNLPEPECVVLFRQFQAMVDGIEVEPKADFTKAKFRAYYTYHHPIFGDAVDRSKLTMKFIRLDKYYEHVKVNDEYVNLMEHIALNEPPTSMEQWWLRISSKTILFERFYYNLGKVNDFKDKPRAIIDFYRWMHHTDEEKVDRRSDAAVELLLNETFPDFLPKLYFEFVRELAWRDSKRPVGFKQFFQTCIPKFE